MKPVVKKAVFCSIAGVLLALVIVLSAVVGAFAETLDKFVVGYKDGGAASSAARAGGAKLAEQIQAEGTVLVKNEKEDGNPLLPLKKSEVPKVAVLGWAATDWVISGSGSGQVKTSEGKSNDYTVTLLDALEESGIEYFTKLTDYYESFGHHRDASENGGGIGGAQANAGSLKSFNYEFSRLYEPDVANETYANLLNEAAEYSSTAFVVLGRVSGESNDSPKVQYKMNKASNEGSIANKNMSSVNTVDPNRTYLEISTEEDKLLKKAAEKFDNVIVLINSTNVMELGFMDTIPGLDACLVVATTGTAGARAIPKLIYSDLTEKDEDGNDVTVSYTPSGKLADTYAYDLSTSSTYVDTGSGNDTTHFYTNSNGLYPTTVSHTNGSSDEAYRGVAYQDYRESVYMGYKWYETADAYGFWENEEAAKQGKWYKPGSTTEYIKGYDDVVQYPFGYGLSYTTFSWDITHLGFPNEYGLTSSDKNAEFTVGVTVTNTGKVPGQDVVELYYTLNPTHDAGIERASVNLLAFGKTQNILKPGESEYVELTFKASDLASYDYEEKIVRNGGYVIEAGEILLTLRTDAHHLAGDKIVTGDKSEHTTDTITLKAASNIRVMEEAKNLFTGEDTTDGVAIDGNSDGSAEITYLSRLDFENTFPFELGESRAMTEKIKALNLYSREQAEAWDADHDFEDVEIPGSGEMLVAETDWSKNEGKGEVKELTELGMELGTNYNDPRWEQLLDVIPKSVMEDLVLHGYTHTAKITAIGKPETLDVDGPNQIFSFTGSHPEATGYSSIVLAQSWNYQLAYSMGLSFGEEAASYGALGWYGPGVNVHRSPFGGRNYEYYSEDALLSGVMCSYTVKAAKNKGVFCWLKHLCLYEGESGRDGMYTWVTEQALREIYLRPFEIAVRGDKITSPYMGEAEKALDGTSTAIMTSYGRIGAVWTGGSEALLTELVRGEWGYKGSFLTDYADHHTFMNGDQMLRAGGDTWMDCYSQTVDPGVFKYTTNSNAAKQQLRNATKNVVYTWLNALVTNAKYNEGIDKGTISGNISIPQSPILNFRWYIPVVVVVDVLLVAGAGVLVLFAFWSPKKKKAVANAGLADADGLADTSEPVAPESTEPIAPESQD